MSADRSLLARISEPVLHPARSSLRMLALATVVANAVLISTGEAVRLSSSGLGCPDWPRCTNASLVAAHSAGQTTLNTWIEFGNRLLNFPLVIVAGLVFIAAWRYRPDGRRRRDLVWLAAAQPGGVIAQAVVGGIVVLTKLNPAWVSVHFLLSSSVLALAVVLHVRCAEGDGPPRPLVRTDLRVLTALLAGAVLAMLAAGTVVTGTGPLAGNATAPRYHLPLEGVTQLHADIGWFLGATGVALVIGLRFSDAPARVVRYGWIMLGAIGIQGVIGYTQYFSHLPAGLVWVHVTTSVVIWILVLRFYLATRERAELPGAGPEPTSAAVAETAITS